MPDANIRRLQQVLDSVVVADPPAGRENAAFGATVCVRQSDGGEDFATTTPEACFEASVIGRRG